MWRGSLQFGLVTMPVRLYSATEDLQVRFHQVHRHDAGRIRHPRVCEACGEEIPQRDIARGYELDDGRRIVLTDADFEHLPLPSTRAMTVLEFVDVGQIDPLHFTGRNYYVLPDAIADRAYLLLREALQQTGQLAIGKIALRQRETLAALRARPDALVLHLLRWPDEVRPLPQEARLLPEAHLPERELTMATSLIGSMSGDFAPEEFVDDTREALLRIVAAKAEHAALPPAPTAPEAEPIDLLAALERSLQRARDQR